MGTSLENVELRTAHHEDKDSINRIYVETTGANRTPDWDRLIQSEGLIVAAVANQIIGFGGIDVTAADQLKWLYILPEYQKSGLGSKILQQLEMIGWRCGLQRLQVHAAAGAVGFYERHGYVQLDQAHQTEHDHEGVGMVKSQGAD